MLTVSAGRYFSGVMVNKVADNARPAVSLTAWHNIYECILSCWRSIAYVYNTNMVHEESMEKLLLQPPALFHNSA